MHKGSKHICFSSCRVAGQLPVSAKYAGRLRDGLANRKSYSLWHGWSAYFYRTPPPTELGMTQTPRARNLGCIQSYPNELATQMTIASSGDKDEVDTGMQIFCSFSEVSSAAGGWVGCMFRRGCTNRTIHFLRMAILCWSRALGWKVEKTWLI